MSERPGTRTPGRFGVASSGYAGVSKSTRSAGRGQGLELGEPRLALSTSQVARRLGVSLGTVRRWSDLGYLPAYRTPGGQRRFSSEDVDAFVSSLGDGGRPERG